jgi:hypothetical protein
MHWGLSYESIGGLDQGKSQARPRVFFSSLLGSFIFQVQYVVTLTIVKRNAKRLWRRERPYAPDDYFVDYPE